jgi:hypothetical protein
MTTDSSSTLVKDEPVLVAHGAAAVLGWVGTLLVTHGIITGDQASATTQTILPFVVAFAILVLGVIVRRFVTPAAHALGFSDADMTRIAAYLESAGFFHQSQIEQEKQNANLPPALPPVDATDAQHGMGAGAVPTIPAPPSSPSA